jgi:hypothetical protein
MPPLLAGGFDEPEPGGQAALSDPVRLFDAAPEVPTVPEFIPQFDDPELGVRSCELVAPDGSDEPR